MRPPTEADFDAVSILMLELGAHRRALEGPPREEARAVFARHVARVREGRALSRIAEEGGRVLGFVTAEVRERLGHADVEVWIPDMVVASEARGRGIGRALMGEVFAQARRVGAFRVILETGHQRAPAQRFYEAIGMRDTGRFYTYALRD